MDGLMPETAVAPVAPGSAIPLDLLSSLEPYREQGGLSIRVERLPFNARLSKGRNNGDNSWSLTVDELADLQYLPPADFTESHNLTVRVIRVDSDSASTLMRYDIPIALSEVFSAASSGVAVPLADTSYQDTGAEQIDYGAAYEPAPVDRSTEPAVLEEEPAAQPAAPSSDAYSAPNGYDTGVADYAVQVPPVSNGYDTTAAPYPAEPLPAAGGYADVYGSAGTDAGFEEELDRRLNEARTAWEAEHQSRVAAAVQDARVQLDQSTEVRLSMELEHRLGEARTAWETEQQGLVATAVNEAVQRAEADARAQAAHESEGRLAQEVDRRLNEARTAWEAEVQGRVSTAVEDAVRQTEANVSAQAAQAAETRIAQEVERRLSESRATWEADHQARVASAVQEAVQRTQMESRAQLERAEQEWRDGSGRELAEMSARCAQAEAALAEARRQPSAGPETDMAVRGLRDELAAAQALIRTRETEVAELRHTLDRAGTDLSGRLSEAEATNERNRAGWQAERDELLARAEADTQERLKQALERWQHETQEALAKAKQDWMEAEDTRLIVAEAEWRKNIGIAKSRAPITPMMKRGRRMRGVGHLKRYALILLCLGGAFYAYPRVAPIVVNEWWPKIVAYQDDIKPMIDSTTKKFKAWLTEMEKRGEAILKEKQKSQQQGRTAGQ